MLPRAGPSGKEAASQQARTWLMSGARVLSTSRIATPLAGEPASSTYARRRRQSSVVTRAFVAAPGLVGQDKVPGTSAIGTTATTLMLSRPNPPDSRRRCVGVRSAGGGPRISSSKTGPRAAIETPSHAARPRSAPRTGCVAGPVVRRTRTWWRTERRDRPNEPTEPDRVPYGRCTDQNVAGRSGSAERRRINSSPTPRSSEGAGAGGCR